MNKFQAPQESATQVVPTQTSKVDTGATKKSTAKGERRHKGSSGKFIKALLALVVICAVCLYAWVANTARLAASDLEFLKNRGIRTSVADYIKTIPHEGNDASTAYHAAMTSWEAVNGEDKKAISFVFNSNLERAHPSPSADQQKVIDQQTNLWLRAATSGWCDFAASLGRPPKSTLESEQQRADLRNGIQVLTYAANQQDPTSPAFNDINYASRISGNMSRCALGIAEEINATRADQAVMRGWRENLTRGTDDVTTVDAAERELGHMPPLRSIPQMLQSEFVEAIWDTDNYKQVQREEQGAFTPTDLPKDAMGELRMAATNSSIAWGLRKRYMVKDWRYIFEHSPTNPEDWKGYETAINAARAHSSYPDWLQSDLGGILFMPDLIRLRTERLADRRIARTAIAVIRQRLQIGHLPTTLPNLGTDSIDPFTGKPFKYVLGTSPNPLVSGGFKIYSVGGDLVDNGGIENPVGRNYERDIVQSYP
jgi:hypothetical protein